MIQNWVKQVQKVVFGTHIVDSISEQDSLKNLNILIEDPKFIEKFRALAVKMDKAEGKLTSLWEKNSQDIPKSRQKLTKNQNF